MSSAYIQEVPDSYNPRTTYEGQKTNWRDGLEVIWTLIVCRFFDWSCLSDHSTGGPCAAVA
jgi:hypothetical protein